MNDDEIKEEEEAEIDPDEIGVEGEEDVDDDDEEMVDPDQIV